MTQPNGRASVRRAWTSALVIQAAVIWFEYVSSGRSHSQALISDILHNSADILLVFMTAVPLVMRPAPEIMKASKNFSVAINVIFLMAGGVAGVWIGIRALKDPQLVIYSLAWPAALASLIGNLLIYGVVRPFRHDHGARIFGWHQLWDVAAAMTATLALWFGSKINAPYLDAFASITIGVFMFCHWPVAMLFDRNGHNHCH